MLVITKSTELTDLENYLSSYKSRQEVLVQCNGCSSPIKTIKTYVIQNFKRAKSRGHSGLRFCTPTCQAEYYNKLYSIWTQVYCAYCGVQFKRRSNEVGENNFCSKSCAASLNNSLHPKRKKGEPNYCDYCGKELSSKKATTCIECRYKHVVPKSETRLPYQKRSEEWKRKNRERVKERLRQLKTLAVEYLGGSCQRCGYDKSVWSLHFHHLDPTEKDFNISGQSRSWEATKAELDKCVLLCGNCHAEEHSRQRVLKHPNSYARRRKQQAVDYKGGSCESCGYKEDNSALVFHHKNPHEKNFSISQSRGSFENIKNELDKCVLLCFNCHAEVHEKIFEEDKASQLQ